MNEKYLQSRRHLLTLKAQDEKEMLIDDVEVYAMVIDVPTGSDTLGNKVISIGLLSELVTELYLQTGETLDVFEIDNEVHYEMQQLLFYSIPLLPIMERVFEISTKESEYRQIHLRTRESLYYLELSEDNPEHGFLNLLIDRLYYHAMKTSQKING